MNNNKKKIDLEELSKKLSQENKKFQTLGQKIDSISERLLEFLDENKENIRQENLERLKKYINSSIGILKTSNFLYIPMIWLSNAGKSTFLNGLIGCIYYLLNKINVLILNIGKTILLL